MKGIEKVSKVKYYLWKMALFQTDGWNLNDKVVKIGGGQSKKKANKNRKRRQEEVSIDDINKLDDKTEDSKDEIRSNEANEDKSEEKPKKKQRINKEKKSEEPKNEEPTEAPPALDLPVKSKLTPLQQKMMAKLTGSRFRWINEQLYTITSNEALKLIKDQPSLFDEYHDGFRSQVQSWPENPVDVFVNQVKERSKRPVNAPGGLPGLQKNKKIVIADMGCGEAQFSHDISKFLTQRNGGKKRGKKQYPLDIEVHSFDLKKANERITVADIRNVPLEDNSCTIVIFCLALMCTNFLDFIKEAYRILAPRGELWIAEIKSRFSDKEGEEFTKALTLNGFFHKKTDNENKMFTRFEFFKAPADIIAERKAKLERKQRFIEHEDDKDQLEIKRGKVPEGKWLLKPCIYKRR